MHYLSNVESTENCIPCYNCGDPTARNGQNLCISCLRSMVDITSSIGREYSLHMCPHCDRFCVPPGKFVAAPFESAELLRICLGRVGQLRGARLVDASFVWTEPHSRRIKVKLVLEKPLDASVLQQSLVVEFAIASQMCGDCHKVEAHDYWSSVVQVRQRSSCRKALFYVEQGILKYDLPVSGVRKQRDGLDLYNSSKTHSDKLSSFLASFVPSRVSHSKQLRSQDVQNSRAFFHYTTLVEIVPVNKHSLVVLPPPASLFLCHSISRGIHMVDPLTARKFTIQSGDYWRRPFQPLLNPDSLQLYLVVEVSPDEPSYKQTSPVAHCWVLPENSTDYENGQIYVRTHLGNVLRPGDLALGYDLANCNVNNDDFDALRNRQGDQVPFVVLVKKFYARKFKKRRRRPWKLRHLVDKVVTEDCSVEENHDYENFLDDLEEDPLLRLDVNIYKDLENLHISGGPDEEEEPDIDLSEMLSHMEI